MKKFILLFLIVSTVGCAKKIYTDNEYFNCNKTSYFKADTDKRKLIYVILERATVSEKDIPDYQLIKNKNKIYINNIAFSKFFGSIEKPKESPIEQSDVPNKINNVEFCVKSESELQKIADKTDSFLYLTFGNIEINENSAKIGLSNFWIVSEKHKGKMAMMSGGGYVWEFKKINGNWKFEKILSHFQS